MLGMQQLVSEYKFLYLVYLHKERTAIRTAIRYELLMPLLVYNTCNNR